MPLVKFFVIVILLACMHSCGKYPADGGSADTDKLYAEGMAELKENQYNKALSKLLRYVQIEERNSRKDTLNLMKAYYNVGWKSHATLTLLAKQDLPTFGYNMIDPLKSWCWGSILFYPFKISRFS